MRVLFLAHRLPYPPDKGDKIRSFRELEALARPHEVDLFCFYDQPQDRQYFPDVRRYCRTLYAEAIPWLRSRVQAGLAWASQRPFTPAFFHSHAMARRVRETVSERSYDLIFVFGSAMAPYAEGFSHLPRVLDMVDVDSDKWSQYARYSRPPMSWVWSAEGKRLFEYEKHLVQKFSMTLLSTPAEAEILRRAASDGRIEVVENRMDTSYFDPMKVEIPSEVAAWQPYVIFTGSMDYFPNVDAVTIFYRDAFPHIRARFPKARFVIAGRNPTSAVRKLARDPAVLVTGAVADIRPYLKGAFAAIAPLRVARGVQTKIIEAMAMGLPMVVSTKVAMALPQPLRKQVQVEDDPERLAEALITILRDCKNLGANTRIALLDWVARSDWEQRWESVLARAVSRNAHEIRDVLVVPSAPRVCAARKAGSYASAKVVVDCKEMAPSLGKQENGD